MTPEETVKIMLGELLIANRLAQQQIEQLRAENEALKIPKSDEMPDRWKSHRQTIQE